MKIEKHTFCIVIYRPFNTLQSICLFNFAFGYKPLFKIKKQVFRTLIASVSCSDAGPPPQRQNPCRQCQGAHLMPSIVILNIFYSTQYLVWYWCGAGVSHIFLSWRVCDCATPWKKKPRYARWMRHAECWVCRGWVSVAVMRAPTRTLSCMAVGVRSHTVSLQCVRRRVDNHAPRACVCALQSPCAPAVRAFLWRE